MSRIRARVAPAPTGSGRTEPRSARCPNGTSPISIPGWISPAFARRPRRAPRPNARRSPRRYRGTLDGARAGAEDASTSLGAAVQRYEAIEDLLGRIMSYAGLVYSGDTTDPQRAKFYGDMQERLTAASSDLLFFALELNRIDDAVLDAAMASRAARPLPALARGHPQGQALPARRQHRAALPREVGDRARRLEPAVRRDDRVAALRRCDGEELTLEPTLNKLQDADGDAAPATPPRRSPRRFKANLRIFTLITNTLAKDKEISDRWRGFEDVADSRHLANRVEREVVDALVAAVREAYPRLSHRYYALKARWFGKDALDHWDRNAPLPKVEQRTIPWDEARDTVLSAYAGFSPQHGRHRPALLRRALDRRAGRGPARRRAPSRIRPCRRRTPTCCSTTRASRAT